jgi:hypothetical protein
LLHPALLLLLLGVPSRLLPRLLLLLLLPRLLQVWLHECCCCS